MEQFEYMWTTEKDKYCLGKSDFELDHNIFATDMMSMVLIKDGPMAEEAIQKMLATGCLVFATDADWTNYVKSRPGYTDVPYWDQPGAESPFSPKNRPVL